MKKIKIIICVSMILFLVLGILGMYIYKWEHRPPVFEVHFFSLKRGRAIFIRTPENKTILVGAGQNTDVIRELTKVIPFYSKKINYIFIPSATPAQIGGFVDVLDRYDIDEVFISKIMSTSTIASLVLRTISKNKIHTVEVERGDEIKIGGVHMNILFPVSDDSFKFNKSSLPELGISFSYEDTSLYLLGNLSKTIQNNIVEYLDTHLELIHEKNILEYYHSAAATKFSTKFLEKINPHFIFSTKEKSATWISDGRGWTK